jgi:hypothetical protein
MSALRIPGPYVLDRAARTIHTADGTSICFGKSAFGEERDRILETLRFFVAAANACDAVRVSALEAGKGHSVELALSASVDQGRAPDTFDISRFTERFFGLRHSGEAATPGTKRSL